MQSLAEGAMVPLVDVDKPVCSKVQDSADDHFAILVNWHNELLSDLQVGLVTIIQTYHTHQLHRLVILLAINASHCVYAAAKLVHIHMPEIC